MILKLTDSPKIQPSDHSAQKGQLQSHPSSCLARKPSVKRIQVSREIGCTSKGSAEATLEKATSQSLKSVQPPNLAWSELASLQSHRLYQRLPSSGNCSVESRLSAPYVGLVFLFRRFSNIARSILANNTR